MPLCTDNSIIIDGDTATLNIPKDLKKFFKYLDKKKNKGELENIKKVELNAPNGYELNFKLNEYFPNMEEFESKSLKKLKENTFDGFKELKTVNLPYVTDIGPECFCNSGILKISMNSVITVGNSAFRLCPNLKEVKMNKVKTLGSYAFSGCTELTSVEMNDVKTLGRGVFMDCISLNTVKMENITDEELNKYLDIFSNCWNVKKENINMPKVNERTLINAGMRWNKMPLKLY